MAGLGHGTGAGALSAVNAPSPQVAQALRDNPKLKAIASIAGRLSLSAKKEQAAKTDHGREEICDVELGNDVERLLPSEMVLMGDPELEPLLMRRLLERQAMQYKLRGTEKTEKGPIVVLVDSSGSMSGARNEWAMGVALAMLEIAAMQKRAFALGHFTTKVEAAYVIPNPRALTLDALIEMVCYFASGGTSVQKALEYAYTNLVGAEASLKDADVLLITDGASGDFSAEIDMLREDHGVSTYGIAIASEWHACNRAVVADYHQITDEQIRVGAESIDGVLAL